MNLLSTPDGTLERLEEQACNAVVLAAYRFSVNLPYIAEGHQRLGAARIPHQHELRLQLAAARGNRESLFVHFLADNVAEPVDEPVGVDADLPHQCREVRRLLSLNASPGHEFDHHH